MALLYPVLKHAIVLLLIIHSILSLPIVKKGDLQFEKQVSSGFILDKVYSHRSAYGAINEYNSRKREIEDDSSSSAFATRADWIVAYAEMCEQSYPLPSLIVDGYPAETAYRQNVHNVINPNKLKNESFEVQDIFVGDRANDNSDEQVGVHVLVYTNPVLNHTTVVFQGSFSAWDAYMDVHWWRDWVVNEQAGYSSEQWKLLGNDGGDIERDSATKEGFLAIVLDLVMNMKYPSLISALHDSTDIDTDTLKQMGYFAVAKSILDKVIPEVQGRGDTLSFTGHSLGGTLASLAHMYLLGTTGKVYDTVAFGGIGLQCLARSIIPEWVDTDFNYPNITNYIDNYDLFPMFDSQPGVVCKLDPDLDQREEALKTCAQVMGKGVALFASSDVRDDWSVCRIYTHGIYHYMRFAQDRSLLHEDGTSSLGCGFQQVAKCPKYGPSAAYVGIWFAFALVMLIIAFLLFVLLPRIIYVKTCGKGKPIIPNALKRCASCGRWKRMDIEMK